MGMFGIPATLPVEERGEQRKRAEECEKALKKRSGEERQKKREKEKEMEKLLQSKSKNELISILMDDYRKCPANLNFYFWWEAWNMHPPK